MIMIGECSASEVETNLATLMKAAGLAYVPPTGVVPQVEALQNLLRGSPLGAVLISLAPDVSSAVANALGEVLFECRGALDYAVDETPVHRLACRVVQALSMLLDSEEQPEDDARASANG